MTELEFEAKQAELERLLNDPDTRMDPERIWLLLAELSAGAATLPGPSEAVADLRV